MVHSTPMAHYGQLAFVKDAFKCLCSPTLCMQYYKIPNAILIHYQSQIFVCRSLFVHSASIVRKCMAIPERYVFLCGAVLCRGFSFDLKGFSLAVVGGLSTTGLGSSA